jgi:hypothetical protein
MARAIVRYSINGETSNVTGNAARMLLQNQAFDRLGTASFEADGPPQHDLLDTLRNLLVILENPPGGGSLDHLWIYLDEPDDSN